jgi:hypothetical protein
MSNKCPEHNEGCGSPLHKEHLCYFISQGFNTTDPQEYKWMTENPKFKCRHCGRSARCSENLCEPANL